MAIYLSVFFGLLTYTYLDLGAYCNLGSLFREFISMMMKNSDKLKLLLFLIDILM